MVAVCCGVLLTGSVEAGNGLLDRLFNRHQQPRTVYQLRGYQKVVLYRPVYQAYRVVPVTSYYLVPVHRACQGKRATKAIQVQPVPRGQEASKAPKENKAPKVQKERSDQSVLKVPKDQQAHADQRVIQAWLATRASLQKLITAN